MSCYTSFSSTSGSLPHSPEKVNLTSCYKKEDWVVINKLDEFYKLPQEDFDSWNGGLGDNHNFLISIASCMTFSQFQVHLSMSLCWFLIAHHVPQVLQLLLNIYFLGGHDTISPWHASLIPDTIRVLMLVKHRLRLARINLTKKDQH